MTLRFLVVFLCLRLVWLKKRSEIPGGAGSSRKDFFRDEVESGRLRGTAHLGGVESVEGRADSKLGGWGYEVVQGTNTPFSYRRMTTSDSSRRLIKTTVTRAREPFKSTPGRNWCAFVKSRLSTAVVSCGVEQFVQRIMEPCVNGMVNCQNGLYQLAVRPLYKVKQKIVTSLEWKCCPGYTGSKCEDPAPEALTAPASLKGALGGEQVLGEIINPTEPATSTEDRQDLDWELHHVQDDVSATTASTQAFQELLNNLTKVNPSAGNKENGTEFPMLQDILKPHIENYLRKHLHSLWTTFSKKMQDMSDMVLNLSQDIEVNRKNINELTKQRMPQRELEEISTKLQSKLDENTEQLQKIGNMLDDQQQKLDYELHAQKVNLDHNLTIIKAETDLKVKRSQKMIQIKSHILDNTTAEIKSEQDRLWQEVYILKDLAKVADLKGSKPCSPCDSKAVKGVSEQGFDQLRETVEVHSRNITHLNRICESCHPASKVITDLRQQLKELEREMNQKLTETSVGFTENVLRLNVSFNHRSSSHEELLYNLDIDVKEMKQRLYRMTDDGQLCDCQKLIEDYGLFADSLRNASNFMEKMYFDLTDVKQQELDLRINLNYSVQDLFRSSQQRHQDVQNLLYSQEEKINTLAGDITTLEQNSTMIMGEIRHLKKMDAAMNSHIRYLNSSFSSLLEDALRHTIILQSVTGQDILEITSDGATELQKLSISTLYQNLSEAEKDIATHKIILQDINSRVQVLEEGSSNDGVEELIGSGNEGSLLKANSSEMGDGDRLSLEHMEANHQVLEKEQMDDSKYDSSEISSIKKDIEMLNLKVIKLESNYNNEDPYYNQSLEQIKELVTKSVETVQSDVSSLKQFIDSHISVFQKFIGHASNLSNGTFRIGRGHFGSKRLRKQHRQSHHGSKQLEIYGNASMAVNQSGIPNSQEFQVAFYVGLSNNSGRNMILKFDQIFLNHGDGYSSEKGYFKVPFKGVYVFVVTVEFSHGPGHGHLLVDGHRTVTLHNSRKRHQHSSLVWGYAILQLSKGQRVWVEVTQGTVMQQTLPETTFGGFLLFKTF